MYVYAVLCVILCMCAVVVLRTKICKALSLNETKIYATSGGGGGGGIL